MIIFINQMPYSVAKPSGFLSLFIQFLSLLFLIQNTISISLQVIPQITTINTATVYDWKISGLTGTTTSIILAFPALTAFNSTATSVLQIWNNTTYTGAYTFSGNNIVITILSANQSSTTMNFKVTNVRNPVYFYSDNAWVYKGAESASYFINYQKGTILNCALSFTGVTDATVSTAFLDFQTTNPTTNGQTIFKIIYGSYTSINSRIVQNGNMTCAYSINGGSFSTEVSARNIVGKFQFNCQFSGLNLPANSQVKLRFSNARNPPYKNNYFIDPFRVQTYEGGLAYDSTSGCLLNDVTVDIYKATFASNSRLINSVYSNPSIQSQLQIFKDFQAQDKIIIEHNGIELPRLGSSIYLSRPSSVQPSIQFNFISGTETTDIITQSNTSNVNTQNRKVSISMTGFDIKMQPSASPVNVTFRFYRNYAINTSLVLEYLNIYATLQPIYDTLTLGELNVTVVNKQIGQPTNYQFDIRINQPLSNQAFILLNLPLEISIINQSNVISTCIFQSTDLSVNAGCFIKDANNKVVQIDLNSSSGISKEQTISITLGLLVNPDSPQRSYLFGAETYYRQGDFLSKVELGAGIFSLNYIQRAMNVSLVQPFYTVAQNPAVLTFSYIPGVKIPANLLIMFTFNTSITQIVYKNVSVDGNTQLVYSPSTSGQRINLTVSNLIPANSSVVFKFEFKAPSAVTTYRAASIEVRSAAGVLYEKTSSVLSIDVNSPAQQVFTLTPLSSTAGVVTNYTLSFFSNIFHPTPFYISIKFPSDVTINQTLNCYCSPTTVCKGVIPISYTTGSQEVYLNITPTSNTFSILISNISNPRNIGNSGQFTIKTKTNFTSGLDILSGNTTALIAYPNVANAVLDPTKQYYRMNTQPLSIIATFTNRLTLGDFIRVRFDYRTYVLSSAGSGGISCSSDFICTYDSAQSNLPFLTVIKVVPTTSTALNQSIKFSIYGLNSSSTTFATQQFQIVIRSYSVNLQQMDEGIITYKINCTSPSTLLAKNCRTCSQSLLQCSTCYSGFYLLNNQCVSDCANMSQYQTFPGSGICLTCTNFCAKCISLTQCLTCVPNVHLYENSSCITVCPTQNGYYNTTINSQLMCLRCWSPSCIKCTNGSSNGCLNCGTAYMDPRNPGRCIQNCDLSANYENQNGQCIACNSRCNGCYNGPTYSDCKACRPGYVNVSGVCETGCPQYSVALDDNTCGCEGKCKRCQVLSTRCIECLNSSEYLYNFQCIDSCPDSSYDYFGACKDCNQGCKTCTVNSCVQCLPGYNVYQANCFSECNTVGERFAAVDGRCIQCPEGCDQCNASLQCSVCLNNYTLVDTVCKKTCQLQNNCVKVSPIPEKIIPVPGLITACVWLAIVVVLKLFVLKAIYMPYSYIFVSSIVEYVLIIAVTSKTNTTIATLLANASKRLLQNITSTTTELPQTHHYAALGLLASSLAINYISNFVYLFLFIKYLKKYVPDRQIDKISNYIVVAVGILSNYRFSLMAYSKLFPKPNILVQNQSKLTPIHYMCIASIGTSIIPLSAAGILIYNQYVLTDLFMLGVDLLVIELLSLVFTIWMVTVDKPPQYFEGTKKYTKQDINNTTESFNDKQNLNESKNKLSFAIANMDNSIVQVEDVNQIEEQKSIRKGAKIKSDNQNDPLPVIPVRTSHINIQTMKVKAKQDQIYSQMDESLEDQKDRKKIQHSLSDKKTQRNAKNKSQFNKKKVANVSGSPQHNAIYHGNQQHEVERSIKQRSKQLPKNFSKQRKTTHKKEKNSQDLNIKINELSGRAENNESMLMEQSVESNQLSMKKAASDVIQKEKKPVKSHTQRSSGILPVTMKKRQSFGVFDSEKASSQVDEIDFESLIQTKMIDKTKDKRNTVPAQKQEAQHEEISPSWFNQQNQRFDFEQSSDV